MRIFFACLFLGFLTACGAGPDADSLRNDVEQRLELALPDGAAELVSLERRGSQSDTKAPDGETRRIVYFDAELKLVRDIDFSAWNAPGIAGLISALGTGPRGILGITSGGNHAGDVIRAHGTALYRRDGDTWTAVAPAGYKPPVAPGVVANRPEGIQAILAGFRKVVSAFPGDTSPAQHKVIEEELSRAQSSIRARLARLSDGYAIAAGAEHGQYLRVAKALFSDMGSRAVPLITRGGEENLRLLRAGTVSLAIAQGDAAIDAFEGKGPFEGQGPHTVLRTIASLYPEPMHVLVRADDKSRSVAGLRGKRVAIGEVGSASRTTALRVLAAHGLDLDDIQAHELSIGAALLALQRQEVDAVFQMIGTPADSIRDSLQAMPLRLLPLSKEAVDKLIEGHAGYFAHTIAKGTYSTQDQDVYTVGSAALLLTDTAFSDAEIAALTRSIFAPGHDYSSLGSAQAAQISLATSREGVSVPMHSSAVQTLELMEKEAAGTAAPAH